MDHPNFEKAAEMMRAAGNILLVSHRRPDGDTLGAQAGLSLALNQLGKKTTLACIDEIPNRLQFIPETQKFVRDFRLADFDLVIISDAGASHMTGFHERIPDFLTRLPVINIDHHVSNDNFGTVNIVDPLASSATMIVFRLIKYMGLAITKEIAVALLAGIYNDTGGFVHSNTTQETFQIAAELAATGVTVSSITRPMFRQSTMPQLRLWGYILENIHVNDKKVLSSVVSQTDFYSIGAHSSDTGGIVDLMNTVPEAEYVLLLAEDDGMVKGSLRTQRDNVNVSDIAGEFGGGGHRKASGFRVRGKLEKQVVWKVVKYES